jgi:hypothetical protein
MYPPARVRYTQWKDGSIHLHVLPADAAKLADALEMIVAQLRGYVVESLEQQRAAEDIKMVPPPSRIQMLEAELARAREEAAKPAVQALSVAMATYNSNAPTSPTPIHVQSFRKKADQLEAEVRYSRPSEEENITPTVVIGHAEPDDGLLGPPPAKI